MNEKDFAWPPSDADLAACGVILSGCARARDVDVRVVVHIRDVLPPAPPDRRRHPVSPGAAAPRLRHWGVEQPEAAYPFHVDGDTPVPYPRSTAEAWRAVLAVAAGLSLAVLSYAQFRGARGESPVPELTAALASAAPADTPGVDAVVDARNLVEDASPSPASGERRQEEDRGVSPSVRPAAAALTASVLDEPPRLEALASPAIPDPVEPRDEPAAVAAPPPAAIPVADHGPALEPVAVVAAAPPDPAPADEDHIRGALTRWRTAYSALDASAAREVWPSVDARALERAFQALKSQELRFDRCELTVSGASARAACTGHAIYVPRVGRQSTRTTPRRWTFELKKSDQRWTITSARGS